MTAKKKAASTAGKKSSSSKRSGQRGVDTKTGTEPPKRSVADHSEHPESPGDSTVRHADNPAGRKSAGAKGFPQGEYDVTEPAKKGATKKDPIQNAIEQGLSAEELSTIKAAQKHPKANRLSTDQRALGLEALPIGAILEHEAQYRWRVKANLGGGIRWGHGTTAQEAIDNYLLGSSVIDSAQAAAQTFHDYPASVQKEIEERDAKVAARLGVGVDTLPGVLERREFKANQEAAKKAKAPAPNATTDGPEVASAQLEAGAKRGGRDGSVADPKEKAASNRKAAARRSGAKAKK